MKHCNACGQDKPVDQFYLSKGRPCSPCRVCAIARAKERNRVNPDARKATLAKWRATADRTEENKRTAAKLKAARDADVRLARERERGQYAARREEIAARKREARRADPDRFRAIQKKHRETERAKTYMRVRGHERRATKLRATPAWYDKEAVRQIFQVARVLSRSGLKFSVDHEVPLKHPLVCGLHTDANLVVMPLWQNIAKHNRFDPEAMNG